MRRFISFSLGALFGVAAFGQDLLDCVDPDVLRSLVFPGNSVSMAITTAVPAEISAIPVPGQFDWIGSAERNLGLSIGGSAQVSTSVTAAYRTGLSADAARTLALDALAAAGWEVLPGQGMGMGVFRSASQPVAQPACRDDESVTVAANTLDGRTYVVYGFTRGGNSSACDVRMRSLPFSSASDEQMPTLDLPSDPATGAPARMGGSGGGSSGSGRSARVEFSLDDSVGSVAGHFNRQMASQGWIADASWNGTSTAGSSWTKQLDSGATMLGTLQVTAVDQAQFMVILNVVTL